MNINAFDSLTPEQEAMFLVYTQEYTSKFFNYHPIDKEKATELFQWVYKFSEVPPFKDLYIVSSPTDAQNLANELCGTEKTYYPFSGYGNAWDIGWLSFCSFMQNVLGIKQDDYFNRYHEIVSLGVYDCIQFDDAIILMELPTEIHRNGNKLHKEDGPAIKFGDDFQMYFWNGIEVPEKLIMDKSSITKDDILLSGEDVQQCFLEALGEQVYESIISN